MNPTFPVYIPSKGRFDSRLTVKALDKMGVPYRVIIEEQEFASYASVMDRDKLLILDKSYQRDYDTCDGLGGSKTKGSGPARNFIWDHAKSTGHSWHWVMDDNIKEFYRLNHNLRVIVQDGSIFRCMEDFCIRYANVAMAGPNYEMFVKRKAKQPPFILNTRIYSCNLIRTDVPYRWRGRYNEDTDLSLRMLKDGWCTILFYAFLQDKSVTLKIKGGNTELYEGGAAKLAKSQMIAALHPDVAKVVHRFGRWHHLVDYKPFKSTKLIRRPDLGVANGVDNYGMRLETIRPQSVRP